MAATYSNNYGVGAMLELSGKCHVLEIGDSQATGQIDYLAHDHWPRAVRLRYHYYVAPGTNNSSQVAATNLGYGSVTGASTGDCGSTRVDSAYNIVLNVSSVSLASPAVVTTTANHGLVTGDSVVIAGTNSNATIDGTRTVTVLSATTFTCGVNVTTSAGTAAGTVTYTATTRIMRDVRLHRYPSNYADGTTGFGSGITLLRQIQPTPAHTTAQRGMAWPTFSSNSGKPWFHGASTSDNYMKGAIVYWHYSTNTLDSFALWIGRQGLTTTQTNYITNGVTQHVHSGSPEGPYLSSWSPVIRDYGYPLAITSNSAANPTVVTTSSPHGFTNAGTYNVTIAGQTGGVSINGARVATITGASTFTVPVDCTGNAGTGGTVTCDYDQSNQTTQFGIWGDHEVTLRINAGTGIDETGKTFIPIAAIFARCDSSGNIPWNADGTGASYDAMGRAGCDVSDWLNYCTQADWQAYLTATVLATTKQAKIRIRLGHNVSASAKDVGDGDGAQTEQSGGILTIRSGTQSYWDYRYTALINRIKAAWAANGWPAGNLFFELEIPWVSGQNSAFSTATLAADVANRVKQIAASVSNCSWFSFYDYFNQQAPFYMLHAWTPENGAMLAKARREAMDRATNFANTREGTYTAQATRVRVR